MEVKLGQVKSTWDMSSQVKIALSQFGSSQIKTGQIKSSWDKSSQAVKDDVRQVESDTFWTQNFLGIKYFRTNEIKIFRHHRYS